MAVTLTTSELADRIRVDDAGMEPILSILAELREVGALLVDRYAPDAPDAIQNKAVVLYAGYLYDRPNSAPGAAYAVALVNSGAASLLSPWVNNGN